MQIEVHVGSLVGGALIGAIMSAFGVTVIGPALFPREAPADNAALLAGLDRCHEKSPLYASRVGEIVSVKCNLHKEGKD